MLLDYEVVFELDFAVKDTQYEKIMYAFKINIIHLNYLLQ
jgi:hypothetical protein